MGRPPLFRCFQQSNSFVRASLRARRRRQGDGLVGFDHYTLILQRDCRELEVQGPPTLKGRTGERS
jgi:hypothetical protein